MARFFRRVIRITAEDSPNVRRARFLQRTRPDLPRDELLRLSHILPGVLSLAELEQRRATWDAMRQRVGLDAEFWVGASLLLFPPGWLRAAGELARLLEGRSRQARAIGVDPGEGEANTAMAAGDELGLIELTSRRTPDTSVIASDVMAFAMRHRVRAEDVVIDRGGGGKQIADQLRAKGFNVRTVAFGESLVPDPHRRGQVNQLPQRIDQREDRYAYVNRRAEMYGELSELLDPARVDGPGSWAMPEFDGVRHGEECKLLRHELSVIRKVYVEGRLTIPPKNRRPGQRESKEKTLTELIGHSPDEADAVVLMVHGMLHKASKVKVTVA